jgi:hypothetical protein
LERNDTIEMESIDAFETVEHFAKWPSLGSFFIAIKLESVILKGRGVCENCARN